VSRILIAEDEPRISSFIEKGLRASGLATTVVTSGVQALAMARSGEFDLMILDIGLPELDGFTVLHALRSGSVDLPVLILTARDGIDDTVAGLRGGADDYMSKPFRCDGNATDLTAREFTLVQMFLTHPGQVLSREQILSHVWGYDYEPGSNIVETYIRYLRRKLGPDRIETVRGMGYRLRD
jgi:two-component system, OmpR family, copper resistance phosphate regulon response regulator CusR